MIIIISLIDALKEFLYIEESGTTRPMRAYKGADIP